MLVPLAAFLNAHEAHIFKTRLEAEDIGVFMQGEDFVYLNWTYAMAVGGVRVCVVHEDLAAARAVVAKCIDGTYRAELQAEVGDLDDLKCPACGSASFKSRSAYIDLALLAICFVLGPIFPARARVHRCDNCANWWSED